MILGTGKIFVVQIFTYDKGLHLLPGTIVPRRTSGRVDRAIVGAYDAFGRIRCGGLVANRCGSLPPSGTFQRGLQRRFCRHCSGRGRAAVELPGKAIALVGIWIHVEGLCGIRTFIAASSMYTQISCRLPNLHSHHTTMTFNYD